MVISKPIAGQSWAQRIVIELGGKVRIVGTNGVDVHGDYADEKSSLYKALTVDQMNCIEEAFGIIAGVWGEYEGSDVTKITDEVKQLRLDAIKKEPKDAVS